MKNDKAFIIKDKLNQLTLNELKLMQNEYERLYCRQKIEIKLGLHLIKRLQIRKRWRKSARQVRRYFYKTICKEIKERSK